ncbi:alpha/beta hydrolase [Flavobacteriaceae bacterium TP-CH-4]|uniref:Alpha/beta hydrolase n=2 Tax=Pelagihabitans pacificus TaxID=2696054 RepID=A0A967AV57_9FLAO|nr:alpha/beta hydrolase [Pelagihabitans pacificus]
MKQLLNKYIPLAYGHYFNTLALFSHEKATEKAFRLFCTPRKGQVLPQQKSYLEKAKDTILEVNDLHIQTYRWQGKGPTLLLMHGWESNTYRWRSFIPKLENEGFNIVAMDAPAHGYSGSTLFNAPLYAECAQKVIETYRPKYIIGHSLGGMTMIYNQYKFNNPDIEKLVSLGAPSELSDFLRQYRITLGLNKKVVKSLENYFDYQFNFRPNDFSTSKFAKTLTVPGLLIHDEFDAIASIRCSEQVHANWKDSTLVKTKGLGHSLHQDKVRNQIIDFLKS